MNVKGSEVIGLKVITLKDGKELGVVSDILFDSITGKVSEIEVSQGLFMNAKSGKKRVKVSDILTIGEDATIVKGFAEEKIEEQSKEGGVAGVITQAKDRGSQFIDQMASKASDLSLKAREKAEKFKETGQQKIREVRGKAEEIRQHPDTQNLLDALRMQGIKIKSGIRKRTQGTGKKIQKEAEIYRESQEFSDRSYGVLGGKSRHQGERKKSKTG